MQTVRSRLSHAVSTAICAALIAVGTGITAAAAAQPGGGTQHITVTPSSTELSAPPGGSTQGTFNVINSGDAKFDIKISASPYHVAGVDYDPQFTQLPGTSDASKWIHFSGETSRSLEPHKTTEVAYTLEVPPNTAPGGYYAVLFAESTPAITSDGVVSHNRVGNILYITVQGKVKTSGSAKALGVGPFAMGTSLKTGAIIGNTGGIHFVTTVKTSIKNMFGKTVFTSDVKRHVLPQTERKISSTWDKTPPIGFFHVEQTATVAGETQQLPGQWVLLMHPWVSVVLIIALLLLVIWLVLKRKAKSKKT